jgi:hypothetical protein
MQGGDFIFENGTGGEVSRPCPLMCTGTRHALTHGNVQSIWGGTFKDEKAGLQQKFTERGVVSVAVPQIKPLRVMRRPRRLQCAIPAKIPTAASSSSHLALRRSSTVRRIASPPLV